MVAFPSLSPGIGIEILVHFPKYERFVNRMSRRVCSGKTAKAGQCVLETVGTLGGTWFVRDALTFPKFHIFLIPSWANETAPKTDAHSEFHRTSCSPQSFSSSRPMVCFAIVNSVLPTSFAISRRSTLHRERILWRLQKRPGTNPAARTRGPLQFALCLLGLLGCFSLTDAHCDVRCLNV